MYSKYSPLDDRTLSFGLSIGTGLMLESLFIPESRYDPKRVIPQKVNLELYRKHYYNIYTLARNIVSSITDRKNADHVYQDDKLFNILIEEINIINDMYTSTKCKPILFVPYYSKVEKNFSAGKNGTIVNKDYLLRDYVVNHLNGNSINCNMDIYSSNDHKLPNSQGKVLITTHIALDLLNNSRVPGLELIESHTGKLRKKNEWYTKFHPIGKLNLDVFPFTEELVYLLGEKNISLPTKLNIRKEIHKIAIDKRWTSHTTRLVVIRDLNNNDLVKPYLKEFKKSY